MDVRDRPVVDPDIYAAGTAGGGTAVGGLAGSNEGNGDPRVSELQEATGSSNFDAEDDRVDDDVPTSGPSGGAVGGTPARKRASGPRDERLAVFELFEFCLRGRKVGFELSQLFGIVVLLPRAGEARLQLGDFLAQHFDAFLRLLIHG